VGFSRMDGMKIKNVDRLCELCDSVVNNPVDYWIASIEESLEAL